MFSLVPPLFFSLLPGAAAGGWLYKTHTLTRFKRKKRREREKRREKRRRREKRERREKKREEVRILVARPFV